MKTTYQSEVGKLKSLLIKPVVHAYIDQTVIQKQWQALNYWEAPDMVMAKLEYREFETLVADGAVDLHYLPTDDQLTMDSIYCRDASISTDQGMIICRMGKSARSLEPEASRKLYHEIDLPVLGEIKPPGTLEGGDVAWLDTQTLAVGHSYRTNVQGIDQLSALLQPLGVEVITVPLPHYRGPDDVFHLMSIFSPVDKDLAVVYAPLMPISFRNSLLDLGYKLLEVPAQEFDSLACNVLALAPRRCMMAAGNPVTQRALVNEGCEVMTYPGQEISVKGGGGPTCLTRPLLRYA
ncbi:MAG: arginine deiminase family protein [Cyclobacteriaceae bacterium]|nr:arginine deiminase family protein [Cyclobacteriaceae bacterium]